MDRCLAGWLTARPDSFALWSGSSGHRSDFGLFSLSVPPPPHLTQGAFRFVFSPCLASTLPPSFQIGITSAAGLPVSHDFRQIVLAAPRSSHLLLLALSTSRAKTHDKVGPRSALAPPAAYRETLPPLSRAGLSLKRCLGLTEAYCLPSPIPQWRHIREVLPLIMFFLHILVD